MKRERRGVTLRRRSQRDEEARAATRASLRSAALDELPWREESSSSQGRRGTREGAGWNRRDRGCTGKEESREEMKGEEGRKRRHRSHTGRQSKTERMQGSDAEVLGPGRASGGDGARLRGQEGN